MSLNHEKMISLLAKEMEVEEDVVVKHLDNLVKKIKENVPKSPVRLQGVGIFSIRNGQLTFDPGISLATEVNYKYAGMAPVPVDQGKEVPEPEEKKAQIIDENVADEEAETTNTKSEKKPVPKKASKSKPATQPADNKFEIPEKETINDDPFADVIGEEPPPKQDKKTEVFPDKASEIEKKESGVSDDEDPFDDVIGEETPTKEPEKAEHIKAEIKKTEEEKPKSTDTVKQEPAKEEIPKVAETQEKETKKEEPVKVEEVKPDPIMEKNEPPKPQPTKEEEKKQEPVQAKPVAVQSKATPPPTKASVVVPKPETVKPADKAGTGKEEDKGAKKLTQRPNQKSSLTLVVAIILLLIVITGIVYLAMPELFTGKKASPITQVQPPPRDVETPVTMQPEPSQPDLTSARIPVPPAQTESEFGLQGTEQTLSGRVYTIVVHSLPNRRSADLECNKIADQDLRCIVREAELPNGTFTFRVGIGQFQSISAAQKAIQELPESYRINNFIIRAN